MAALICFRLARHLTFFASCRAPDSPGNRIEISSTMMLMTTSSSMSVNPRRLRPGTASPCSLPRHNISSALSRPGPPSAASRSDAARSLE